MKNLITLQYNKNFVNFRNLELLKILIIVEKCFYVQAFTTINQFLFHFSQLFWTDRHYPRIESSNLDGTGRRIFVEDFIGQPNSLAIDFQNRQLCWTDAGTETGYLTVNPKIGRSI